MSVTEASQKGDCLVVHPVLAISFSSKRARTSRHSQLMISIPSGLPRSKGSFALPCQNLRMMLYIRIEAALNPGNVTVYSMYDSFKVNSLEEAERQMESRHRTVFAGGTTSRLAALMAQGQPHQVTAQVSEHSRRACESNLIVEQACLTSCMVMAISGREGQCRGR